MPTQLLDVGDQIRRGIVDQRSQRRRSSGAPLIEDYDAVMRGIEEAAMGRRGPRAGTAVQEHHSRTPGVAALLPVHRVRRIERQRARGIGLDGREKILPTHGFRP